MKTPISSVMLLACGSALFLPALCLSASGQSLLNISGTSLLAPSIAPAGGYAVNPQEYLVVSWTIAESASDVYTYSYTVQNPAGDVLLDPSSGNLTSTPEIFDAFSVDFDTTIPGAYIAGTQSGGAFREVNNIDLAWFFSPSVPAGTTGPAVSFESDLAPAFGNAGASDAVPPSPWSTVGDGGQMVPVPASAAVPEPGADALLAVSGMLFLNFRRRPRD